MFLTASIHLKGLWPEDFPLAQLQSKLCGNGARTASKQEDFTWSGRSGGCSGAAMPDIHDEEGAGVN